jgi:restriction system protein
MEILQLFLVFFLCAFVWGYIGRKIEEKRQKKNEEIKKEIERIFPSEEFEHWEEKFLQDDELIALNKYRDEIRFHNENKLEVYLNKIKNEKYVPQIFLDLSRSTEVDKIIDIDEVPDILWGFSEKISFYKLFALNLQAVFQRNEPNYPLPEPIKPKPIKIPPCWSSWSYPNKEFNDDIYKNNKYFLDLLGKKRNLQRKIKDRNEKVEKLSLLVEEKFQLAKNNRDSVWEQIKNEYAKYKKNYFFEFQKERDFAQKLHDELNNSGEIGLLSRIDLALKMASIPFFISREGTTKFDSDSGILIHEHKFPDLATALWVKSVKQKYGETTKPANQKETKDASTKIFPSLSLRLAAELARLDTENIVKAIVINGWADYVEKSTGQTKRAYCSSLFAYKEQILGLNLQALDPIAAFSALKGITASNIEITPIAPILCIDTNDSRFVDSKEVLANLVQDDNLAAMDWEDFEHLCRELFEKAFAAVGAEVRVTQASRDQGVDAIIFDPDPLRGGKIIVQAKRYTNRVDVSAIRDLYGAVINEGATKGILVTTSHYGPDAYAFSKDKPITLLNGSELLGLLEKYGYKFRINLAEAKLLK